MGILAPIHRPGATGFSVGVELPHMIQRNRRTKANPLKDVTA
ncbi:hypothetical protein [Croceicoccus sediminis]|nr:hypothetical protein [Croceicoccus sediminis]